MARQFVKDLKDGDSVDEVFLLTDKQLRANRNANLYLLTGLRDRTGMVNGLKWNVTEDTVTDFEPGDFVTVKGKAQLFQGNMQLILSQIQKMSPDQLDRSDFETQPNENVDQLLVRLREILLSIDDPSLRGLMECFLIDEPLIAQLVQGAAGIKVHHAYPGGLLEHIVNMLETARRIEDLYPQIDINLLLAGVFLHDLGKVRELSFETGPSYTDEGQLLGHLILGLETLDQKIAEVRELTGEPFPQETTLRLKHMILSHHGTYESGSPKLPMTPEAIALHYLDSLDSKVHEFHREIDADPNSHSNWTPYIPRIGRKLFKGSSRNGSEVENEQ